MAKIRSYSEGPDKDAESLLTYKQAHRLIYGEDPDDSDQDADGPLTYEQAQELIWEMQMEERQGQEVEFVRENLIELVARTDYHLSLTVGRVNTAAKALDAINPGWMDGKDNWDVLVKKVVELNPELAAQERWPTHGPDRSHNP